MTSTCRNGRERRGRRAPNIYSADLVRGSRRYCGTGVCVCAAAHNRGLYGARTGYGVYQETIITRFQHFAICAQRLRTRRLRRVRAINSRRLLPERRRKEMEKQAKLRERSCLFERLRIYTPPCGLTSDTRTRVRTYAYRWGPAACACVGGTKRPQRGVASERTTRRW